MERRDQMTIENLRLAVLIDGDNAPRDCLKSIMEEIAIYGTPMIKRIYGDWASHGLASWKDSLLENAVTPKQQFAYTTGKNATDSAMIIDAMDILYTGKTDGFVLVSSDSDFTPLAIRLRESGMYVIGIGEEKTPKAFVQACDKFIRIEVIRDRYKKPEKAAQAKKTAVKKTAAQAKAEKTEKTTASTSKTAAKKAAERKANANEDPWGDKELREMQLALQEELGRRVTINRKGVGGILTIAYSDEDDLIDLVDKLLDGD